MVSQNNETHKSVLNLSKEIMSFWNGKRGGADLYSFVIEAAHEKFQHRRLEDWCWLLINYHCDNCSRLKNVCEIFDSFSNFEHSQIAGNKKMYFFKTVFIQNNRIDK